MTQKSSPTPTDWRVYQSGSTVEIVSTFGDNEHNVIADVFPDDFTGDSNQAWHRAHRIVRAVNSHPDLLAACETIDDRATYSSEHTVEELRERIDDLYEIARAAIAKAQP